MRAWRAAYAAFLPAGYLAALDPDRRGQRLGRLPGRDASGAPAVGRRRRRRRRVCRTGPADDADLGGRAAEIYGLSVEPGRIGTGVGRALVGQAVADLGARGFWPLCVYAYAPNRGAIRFYQQAGFTLDGASRLDQHGGIGVAEVGLVAGRLH